MPESAFVPLTDAPPDLQRHGVPYELRLDWLQRYVHGVLHFVRGETVQVWDAERQGWHVRGERRTMEPALPKRGVGGRFLKKGESDAG